MWLCWLHSRNIFLKKHLPGGSDFGPLLSILVQRGLFPFHSPLSLSFGSICVMLLVLPLVALSTNFFVILDLGGIRRKRTIFLCTQMPQCNIILFFGERWGTSMSRDVTSHRLSPPEKSIYPPTNPTHGKMAPTQYILRSTTHLTCTIISPNLRQELVSSTNEVKRVFRNKIQSGRQWKRGRYVPFTTTLRAHTHEPAVFCNRQM